MPLINRKPVTIEEEQEQWLKSMPERFHKTYHKAMGGKSLRAAINAKCYDCMNWQIKDVHRCEFATCPLWPYRPKSTVKNRGVAIAATVGAENNKQAC